jgi:hypothetical protein
LNFHQAQVEFLTEIDIVDEKVAPKWRAAGLMD